ncbi:MAG: alpha/beta hydrolase [Kiritimatiellia bacterium]
MLLGHPSAARRPRGSPPRPAKSSCSFGSAGIPPKRPPSYYAKVYTYKTVKLLTKVPVFAPLFRDISGAHERPGRFRRLPRRPGFMRASLVRSVNEDLRPVFAKVACPTLLVWGRNDTATPVSDARRSRS